MAEATPKEEKTYTAADLQQLVHDYQVPVSDGTVKSIAGEGTVSEGQHKAFEGYLQTAAQGLYPALAPQIAGGLKTAYLLDPYRQVGKQILGENFEPDFINNHDHMAALQGGQDPTGRPTPMSLNQWANHIRSTPSFGWGYTEEAHARANTILQTLQSALGSQPGGGQ